MKTIVFLLLIIFSVTSACYYSKKVYDTNNPSIKLCQNQRDHHFANSKFVYAYNSRFSCIDARSSKDELLTFGGDSGEFLLGLATWQNISGESDTQIISRISSMFNLIINVQPTPLYLHSDEDSEKRIQDKIRETLKNPNLIINFQNPEESYKEQLLKLVTDKSYVGCDHIRSIMENPTQYKISTELVSEYLRIFYTNLWNNSNNRKNLQYITSQSKPRVELVNSVGNHNEKSTIMLNYPNYRVKCSGLVLTATSYPNNSSNSAYMYHGSNILDQGIRGRVKKLISSIDEDIDQIEFSNTLDKIYVQWEKISLSKISSHLPIDKIDFTLYERFTEVPRDNFKDNSLFNCQDYLTPRH